jgi:hypothetical protein
MIIDDHVWVDDVHSIESTIAKVVPVEGMKETANIGGDVKDVRDLGLVEVTDGLEELAKVLKLTDERKFAVASTAVH